MNNVKRILGVMISVMLICSSFAVVSVSAADGVTTGTAFNGIYLDGSADFISNADSLYTKSVKNVEGNSVNALSIQVPAEGAAGQKSFDILFKDHGYTNAVVTGVDIKFEDVTVKNTTISAFMVLASKDSVGWLSKPGYNITVFASVLENNETVIKYGDNIVDPEKWYTVFAVIVPKNGETPAHMNLYVKEKDEPFENAVYRGYLYSSSLEKDMPASTLTMEYMYAAQNFASGAHEVQFDNAFVREVVSVNDADFLKTYKPTDTFTTNFFLQPGFESATVSFGDDVYPITDNGTGYYLFEKELSSVPMGFCNEFSVNAEYADTNYENNKVSIVKDVKVGVVADMTTVYEENAVYTYEKGVSTSDTIVSRYWNNAPGYPDGVAQGKFIRYSADINMSNVKGGIKIAFKFDNKWCYTDKNVLYGDVDFGLKNGVTSKLEYIFNTEKDTVDIYVDGRFVRSCYLINWNNTVQNLPMKDLVACEVAASGFANGETLTFSNMKLESSPYYITGINGGKYVVLDNNATTFTMTPDGFSGNGLVAQAVYADGTGAVAGSIDANSVATFDLTSYDKRRDVKVQYLSGSDVVVEQTIAFKNKKGAAINDATVSIDSGVITATTYAVGGTADEYATLFLVQRDSNGEFEKVACRRIDNVATRTAFSASLPYVSGKDYVVYIWDGKTLEPLKYVTD